MTAVQLRPRTSPSGGPGAGGRRHTGGLYALPLLAVLAVWIYGPALATALLSLTDWNLTGPSGGFVGADNFRRLLQEPEFGRAAWRTVLYAVALLPFSTVVPLTLAVMLWLRPSRASTVYRSLLFLPAMIAPVAVAMSWRFLLNPLDGLANRVIGWFGFEPVNWLGNPSTALPVIVVITAARVVAFNLLLFSAALSAVDRRTVEAARLEGATSVEVVRFVVLPAVTRSAVLLGLLSLVLAGQWVFTNVSVLTQGGPDGTTDTVYHLVYTLGFELFDSGAASAAAVMVLAGFLLVAAVAIVVRGRRAAR